MQSKTQIITSYASQLNLGGIRELLEDIIRQAGEEKISYADFALKLFKTEVDHRGKRDLERRIKVAKLPLNHDLDDYDFSVTNGLPEPQLKQLRECMWLEQNFNLIFMGPSGVGYVNHMIM